MNDEPKNLPQEAGDDARLPGHADPAPDGEEPYRVVKTRGHEYTMVWTVVGPAIVGGRIYDDENTAAVDCEDLTAAYSHGFTAGQKGHSDRAEPGVTESLERLLDGRANDETIDVCSVWNAIHEGQQSAASRREGEPQGESMFTPDQQAEIRTGSVSGFAVGDVIGRKRLDTLRECEIAATAFTQGADTAQEVTDPASPDLVAAAGCQGAGSPSEHHRDFAACPGCPDCEPCLCGVVENCPAHGAAALQNTPQPDESEAVRSMIHAAQNYAALPIENTEQARARRFQLVEAINLLAYIAPRLTSRDAPEVDNAE